MDRFSFTGKEMKDILISVAVLSLVFSYPEVLSFPAFFLIALLSVGTAFMGHELAHKFTARSFGFFSEYRMWPQGLLLAVFLAVISNGGFIFAAPGAVVFGAHWAFSQPTREKIGKIGLSGPLFNIAVALLFGLVLFIFPLAVFRTIALINGWLAIFNLIPFPPLDGSKVFAWSAKIWALTLVLALIGFGLAF
jgi:Zn-dependent protease